MTNDGWGKLPTNTDWNIPWTPPVSTQSAPANIWGLPPVDGRDWRALDAAMQGDLPKTSGEIRDVFDPAPTVNDGWGKISTDWTAPDTNVAWLPQSSETAQALDELMSMDLGDDFSNVLPDDYAAHVTLRKDHEEREAAATLSRQTDVEQRASVLNSLSGKRDEWVMETDGELNKREEVIPTVTPNVPTGFYIAYHTGKWLHAVLSGPYSGKSTAIVMADAAYARMTEDSVFKLAFENKFERNGIYIAEIPLSARRHGAYGVLA